MVNQLRGFVSSTLRRPIIINGRLVTFHNQVVYVKLNSNFKVILVTLGRSADSDKKVENPIENGNELLKSYVQEFNKKYAPLVGKGNSHALNFNVNLDPFTQAIVMENEIYTFLLDVDDVHRLHNGEYQFQEGVQTVINDFVLDSILNYFEIFIRLMNRRLMGGYMPISIKGHLVSGLFQPLIVETKYIHCPLRFGEFSWFFEYLHRDEHIEEFLERKSETNRGLGISVIAMSDIQTKFDTLSLQELNRVYWLYMLYYCMCNFISEDGPARFVKRHPRYYNDIHTESGVPPKIDKFFVGLLRGIERIRTGLVVRY